MAQTLQDDNLEFVINAAPNQLVKVSETHLIFHTRFSHLEHLGEEPRTDLLAAEVIYSGQGGHGAAQGPVGGRSDPVGSMNVVHGRFSLSLLLMHDPLRLHLRLGRPGRRRRRREEDLGSLRSLKSSPTTVYISHVRYKATAQGSPERSN